MTEMQVAFTRQDLVQFSQLNANLHRTIQTIANNTTANRLLQTLKSQVVRLQYRAIFLPDRVAKSFAEHGKIVDAICANDGAAAEMAMREHLCEVRDALRQAIQTARSARL
jgi:DNA-binding GntR family transcriptional regulator